LIYTYCIFAVRSVRADTLFEAYSKVLLGGNHVGYFVSRYDFDSKKKQFLAMYLLKTNEAGGSINETLSAVANENLEPVSYKYNSANKTTTKTIEASFSKNKMKAKITINGKSQKVERTIPSGVFLSNFLSYVILKGPEGMKTGTKYQYQAIAEEDGELSSGIAYVKETENYKGLKVFRIVNEFKNMQFISLATDKGEMLSTSEPTQAIGTEVVTDPNLATSGLSVSEKNLKLLFGNVPKGIENSLVKLVLTKVSNELPSPDSSITKKQNSVAQPTDVPTKQMGVPGGKGLILKSQPK
jgi:hypothetical protein